MCARSEMISFILSYNTFGPFVFGDLAEFSLFYIHSPSDNSPCKNLLLLFLPLPQPLSTLSTGLPSPLYLFWNSPCTPPACPASCALPSSSPLPNFPLHILPPRLLLPFSLPFPHPHPFSAPLLPRLSSPLTPVARPPTSAHLSQHKKRPPQQGWPKVLVLPCPRTYFLAAFPISMPRLNAASLRGLS